ncbi:unnamed protein product [Rotaria sp. Silwood1]|nr:unnamed protein product [Rotaria sp. Silwood1]
MSKSDLLLMVRIIDPKNVISLILSDEKKSRNQIRFFLSHLRIDQFIRLRSLTLIDVKYEDLDEFQQHIMKYSLTTFSISPRYNGIDNIRLLSSIISCSDLRKFEFKGYDYILNGIKWPKSCRLEHMTICYEFNWRTFYSILNHLPHLRTLVLKEIVENDTFVTPSYIIQSSHLTSLSLNGNFNITMDNIESLLSLLPSLTHLRLINKTLLTDPLLYDNYRWENFIQTKLPLLNKFEFWFTYLALNNQDFTTVESLIAPFRTSFWLEIKHWLVKCDYELNRISDHSMAILSKYKLDKYQFGTDVRKGQQLYGLSGKIIYEGKWISRRNDSIIIVEMNEAIAEREASFYLEVNDHHNIIHTFGCVENSLNLTIFVQEFAELADLAGVLMDNQFNISQTILVEMFLQISDAMSFIARKKIVHCDLGCRNVLVFNVDPTEAKNNLVKITDFGLARWIDEPPSNENESVIPVRFCAPEILRNNRHSDYSEKSDVYSMGVLMWEALSNSEIPYSSIAEDDDVIRIKLNNEKLKKPRDCDHQLWVLMTKCWHEDPEQRLTFEDINNKLSNIKISEVAHHQTSGSSNK